MFRGNPYCIVLKFFLAKKYLYLRHCKKKQLFSVKS